MVMLLRKDGGSSASHRASEAGVRDVRDSTVDGQHLRVVESCDGKWEQLRLVANNSLRFITAGVLGPQRFDSILTLML